MILLWVNNHFNDFEEDVYMMELLEQFEEKLRLSSKSGECRLFNIACSTKAKSRVVKIVSAYCNSFHRSIRTVVRSKQFGS